ncbi:MAG: class I SAM-dependent methyltransferase [Candidatus Heimdallarchaeota archaeon]
MKDSTKRFSDRVDNYLKYRPRYPQELLSFLLKEKIIQETSILADIGSGTGFFTKLLLGSGCQVFAVEPNKEMREAAEELLKGQPGFTSVDGSAEVTTLKDNSIDFITVAQAFHWFDREKTREEFLRILKHDGYLTLVWNNRIKEDIPFQVGYNDLLIKYCPGHDKTNHYKITFDQIAEFYGGTDVKIFRCTNQQILDFEGLKGRLFSSSYTPKENEPNYQPLLSALKELFDKYQVNGKVTMEYKTKMHYGKMV